MMRGRTLFNFVDGFKGQGQLCSVCIIPCVHDKDYTLSPNNYMQVVKNERGNLLDLNDERKNSV